MKLDELCKLKNFDISYHLLCEISDNFLIDRQYSEIDKQFFKEHKANEIINYIFTKYKNDIIQYMHNEFPEFEEDTYNDLMQTVPQHMHALAANLLDEGGILNNLIDKDQEYQKFFDKILNDDSAYIDIENLPFPLYQARERAMYILNNQVYIGGPGSFHNDIEPLQDEVYETKDPIAFGNIYPNKVIILFDVDNNMTYDKAVNICKKELPEYKIFIDTGNKLMKQSL